jgi:tetratricopeptide (TPR) repeat protein
MEKQRSRRYETVHAFAEDINRYLSDKPISARPPSVSYRLRKFLRRHRRQVAALCGLCVIVAGLLISLAILQTGLGQSRNAQMIQDESTLSEAETLGEQGAYEDASSMVATLLNSPYLGPRARLLHARLLMLHLQSEDAEVMANDTEWGQVIEELEGLLDEQDEIAGQAHILLATIYYESDSEAPASASNYGPQWKAHKQKADELLQLLPETADTYLLRAISADTVPQTLELLDDALRLDPGHFESVKTRAYIHHASADYRKMFQDAADMKSIKAEDPLGYLFSVMAQRGLGWFSEAIVEHGRAIQRSPDDAVLIDQRFQTYMLWGQYARALEDARACARLEPSVSLYQIRVFLSLVALARYDEAKLAYERLTMSYDFHKEEFFDWCTRHVFDMLAAGLSWYPSDSMPTGKAFLALCLADESYRHLSKNARRLIPQGSHPSFSPDGTKLAYALGIHKSTGIAVYDIASGQSKLLAVPGKDPAWSPEGDFIAYTRNRETLPFSVLFWQKPMKGLADRPENRARHQISIGFQTAFLCSRAAALA